MTAFACNKCPRHANVDEGGCPMWWEVLERNTVNEAERLSADCGFRIMPRFLTETMRMAHRAAAQTTVAREEILERVDGATVAVSRGLAVATALAGGRGKPWKAIPGAYDDVRELEHLGTEGSGVRKHAGGRDDRGETDPGTAGGAT